MPPPTIGRCAVCAETRVLTDEHVPARAPGNSGLGSSTAPSTSFVATQVRTLENTARNWCGGDVTVLGITVQDLASDARRFMAKRSLPALTDGKAVAAAALGAAGVPTTVLIDKQGRIALSRERIASLEAAR